MPSPVNSTGSLSLTMKEFYDRNLLEHAKTMFCYANFGQKRSIPKNNGKKVEFRRWNLFTPSTTTQKLSEGVEPDGQSLSMTNVEATVDQYGAWVDYTDMLDLTAYDDIIGGATELLGEQLGTVLDWVTRDAMLAGASTHFCGGRTSTLTITSADKLTIAEVRKCVRTLKKAKARRFTGDGTNGHFVMIVDPDCTYDLQSDQLWQDVSKYSDKEAIYNGEIGKMFGVRFVESTEGKVTEQSVLNKVNANTTSSDSFVLKNTPTDAEVAYLSKGGNKIKIGSTEYTLASADSYTAATKTVKLSASASLTADDIVYSEDAGACDASTKAGVPVHHAIIMGADAYGIIDIEGSGAIRTIVKPLGWRDALDQRGAIGAKVEAYTAKVLNSLWIIDVQCAVSA